MLIIVLQREREGEREGVLIFVKFYNRCSGQILEYAGIQYSSPTLCTAMLNLIPAFTFMLAIIFRSPLLISDSQNEWIRTALFVQIEKTEGKYKIELPFWFFRLLNPYVTNGLIYEK